jgi:hypothetical protein
MSKFRVGTWSVICDVCGFRFQNTEVMKRWDGLMVCEKDYETKHPQLTIRIKPERLVPNFVRPFGTDTFVEVCTEIGRQAVPSYAVAGCVTAGYVSRATF